MPAIASGRRNSVASSAQPVRASKRRQSCTAALPSPAEQPEWPKKRRQVKNACETTCLDSVRKERKKGVSRGPYKRKEGDEESSASPQGTPGLDQQLSESGPFPSASDDGDADEGKADAAGDRYEQNTDSDSGSDSEDPEDFNVEDSTEVVCRKEDAEARDGCGYDKLAILSNLCTAVLQQSETCSEDGKKVLDEAAFEFDGRDGRVYYISGSDGEESEIASNFPVLPSFGSLQTMCDAAVIAQDERTPVRGEIVSSLGPPSRIAQLDSSFSRYDAYTTTSPHNLHPRRDSGYSDTPCPSRDPFEAIHSYAGFSDEQHTHGFQATQYHLEYPRHTQHSKVPHPQQLNPIYPSAQDSRVYLPSIQEMLARPQGGYQRYHEA